MALPKKKISCSRRGKRRSHNALRAPVLIKDKKTGDLRRPHHMDSLTGTYRGRRIIDISQEQDQN